MPQLNDLSRSLAALDQDSTIIAVVELSQSSWLVAGVLPGIERQPPQRPQTPLTRRRPREGTLSLQGPSPPLRLGSNGASTSSMLHPPPRLPRVSGACIHNLDPDGGVITRSFPGTHIAGDAGGDRAQQQVIDAAAANKKFTVTFLIGRPAAVLTPPL